MAISPGRRSSDEEQAAIQACYGSAVRMRPRLDKVRVLVCLEADPLRNGTPAVAADFAHEIDAEVKVWVVPSVVEEGAAEPASVTAMP